jgi:hypothetical protein
LKFKQGNDESIKKFLSGKLKETKDFLETTRMNLHNIEDAYTKVTSTNESLIIDL